MAEAKPASSYIPTTSGSFIYTKGAGSNLGEHVPAAALAPISITDSVQRLERRVQKLQRTLDSICNKAEILEKAFDQHLQKVAKQRVVVDILDALYHQDKNLSRFFLLCIQNFFQALAWSLGSGSPIRKDEPFEPEANAEYSRSRLRQVSPKERFQQTADSSCFRRSVCDQLDLTVEEYEHISTIGDVLGWCSRRSQGSSAIVRNAAVTSSKMRRTVEIIQRVVEEDNNCLLSLLVKILNREFRGSNRAKPEKDQMETSHKVVSAPCLQHRGKQV